MKFTSNYTMLLLSLSPSLLCMQPPQKDLSVIPNHIFPLQMNNNPGLFDHNTICAFALVSKKLNQTVKESAIKRLLYFLQHKEYKDIYPYQNPIVSDRTTWHKYSAACTYWKHSTEMVDEREEQQTSLHLLQLSGCNTVKHDLIQCLPTDIYCSNPPLFNSYRPFFNFSGDACFHTFGQFALQKSAEDRALLCPSFRKYIFHYSISTKGLVKQIPCYVNLGKNSIFTEKTDLKNLIAFISDRTLLEKILRTESTTEILATGCTLPSQIHDKKGVYNGTIKIYNYSEPAKTIAPAITEKQNISVHTTVNNTEQEKITLYELSEHPYLQKRLPLEINHLLENKNILVEGYSVNSKTHPFALCITFYSNAFEYKVTCQIPNTYPFKAPTIFLQTTDDQLNSNDLLVIKKSLNDRLSKNYSPARRIIEMIDEAQIEIESYKYKRFASQQIAQGYKKTLPQLKEKYLSKNIPAGIKYPEFQKKLNGLWIKETTDGYGIFHVEGDYIHIAFEPKYADATPIPYHGSYAAGHHMENDNLFSIHINDVNDGYKTNSFQLGAYHDSISIAFYNLESNSILNTIINHLDNDYLIGERIDFVKS